MLFNINLRLQSDPCELWAQQKLDYDFVFVEIRTDSDQYAIVEKIKEFSEDLSKEGWFPTETADRIQMYLDHDLAWKKDFYSEEKSSSITSCINLVFLNRTGITRFDTTQISYLKEIIESIVKNHFNTDKISFYKIEKVTVFEKKAI